MAYQALAQARDTAQASAASDRGSDGVRKLQFFRAPGYSHLNLYLRLLVILYQLEPNDQRLDLLRAVDEAIERDASPAPR